MDERYTDEVMAAAATAITSALQHHQVREVRWQRGWEGRPLVWLVTETDADKAAVAEHGCFEPEVRRLLLEAGVPAEMAAHASVTVESEETVSQRWRGRWEGRMNYYPPDVTRIMAAAVQSIVSALEEHGVFDVHWFLAYDGEPVCWLATATDAEKAAAAANGFFRDTVLELLAEAGVPGELVETAGVTVESQEYVDRECSGSWRTAMK